MSRLASAVVPAMLFGPWAADSEPSWFATLLLCFAVAGLPLALSPGYVVVDGARRELRIRARLYRFVLRPRTISFDDVDEVIIWSRETGIPGIEESEYLSVWLDLRNAGSIKINSTKDAEYANYLAHTLSERIGVKVAVKRY